MASKNILKVSVINNGIKTEVLTKSGHRLFLNIISSEHWTTRTTNKKTGAKLAHSVREKIASDEIFIEAQEERAIVWEFDRHAKTAKYMTKYRIDQLKSINNKNGYIFYNDAWRGSCDGWTGQNWTKTNVLSIISGITGVIYSDWLMGEDFKNYDAQKQEQQEKSEAIDEAGELASVWLSRSISHLLSCGIDPDFFSKDIDEINAPADKHIKRNALGVREKTILYSAHLSIINGDIITVYQTTQPINDGGTCARFVYDVKRAAVVG